MIFFQEEKKYDFWHRKLPLNDDKLPKMSKKVLKSWHDEKITPVPARYLADPEVKPVPFIHK